MNIYVSNLNAEVNEKQLRQLFAPFGIVDSVKIVTDFQTGLSKGFGFVEMTERADGVAAMKKLDNLDFMNAVINVTEATPKPVSETIITPEKDQGNHSRNISFRRRH
jgi:RNA recognition motif-containing protein